MHLLITLFSLFYPMPASNGNSLSKEIVVEDCRVDFFESQELVSNRSGIIANRMAEGQKINKGAICAKLDDALAIINLRLATKKAELTARLHKSKLLREIADQQLLVVQRANSESPGTFPKSEVFRLRKNAEIAATEIDLINEEFDIATLEVSREKAIVESHHLRSRIDGTVVKVYRNPGEGAAVGEPIVRIVNTEKVRAEGFVPIELVSKICLNQLVKVSVQLSANSGTSAKQVSHSGKIVFIDEAIQPVAGAVRVWIHFANPDGVVKGGMSARVTIPIE